MRHAALVRSFRRILAASMPVPAAAALASCGGTALGSAALEAGPGDDTGSLGTQAGDDGSPNVQPGADVQADVQEENSPQMDATVAPDAPDDASNEGAADAADGMVIVTSCGQTVVVSPGPFGSCYARCFPLEAGALDSIDAGDSGVLSRTQCTPICGAGSWFSCTPFVDAGASIVSCQPDCTGRRPGGLQAAEPARGSPLGAYFAEMARLEAASVDAFRQLRRELIAQRAPRRLIRETERAARDEVRHARMTRALARRYGGVATAPEVEAGPARSLEAIALENAVEGCVREAFGALVASWQALAARDPVIRAAMARIARDETRHAALAFAIDGWARGRMDRTARARVDQSRQQAIESLAARAPDAPAALRAALGLPTRAQTLVLIEQMGKLAA